MLQTTTVPPLANVPAIGAPMIAHSVALDCLHAFTGIDFQGSRHNARAAKPRPAGNAAA